MIRKVALYSVFALLALSCLEEPDCYNLNNNLIGISFRKMADNKSDTVRLIGITLNGSDSVFHSFKLATGVGLPVDVLGSEEVITFYFDDINGPVQRTLRTTYTSRVQFVSEDCGERFIVSNLRLEDHDFDSVRLVNDQPGKQETTNFIVYRCPITDRMKISFRQLGTTDSIGAPMDVFLDGITSDFSPGVLYPDDTASSFILPLNPESTSVAYNFDFKEGSGDLVVDYRTTTTTRYGVCGSQTFFAGLTASSGTFDKVLVVRDSIRDPAITNVLVQRCPETNLIRIDFRDQPGDDGQRVAVELDGITTDYSPEVLYADTAVNSVILPLNDQADVTRFTFEFESGSVDLEVGYTRTPVVLHKACSRFTISGLNIVSSGFATDPEVIEDETSFPVNTTNLAIFIPD
ncbi:MAG: hypothetical protein DIU61_003435 [Bacteroidota bacterium]|jgi:hypothetical protein|nr:MAG: hypothetical protein DIU61_16820 [Bacteroidota bacterium]